MFRTRQGRTLLGIAILLVLVGLLDLAVDGLLYFGWYSFLGLLALRLLVPALAPIARRRGWGSEGRLTRFLSRPRFVDESRRTSYDTQTLS
jgi:hypothetical protein